MTAEEQLDKIAKIFETNRWNDDGTYTTNHARSNLEGALCDLQTAQADKVCLNTISRVVEPLRGIELVLSERISTRAMRSGSGPITAPSS